MKIAMVNRIKIEGGKGVHVRELSKCLRKLGHEVHQVPRYQGVSALARYLSKLADGYEVIHVHEFDPPAIVASYLSARARSKAAILTVHQFGPPEWYRNPVTRNLVRSSLKRFNAIVCISRPLEKEMAAFMGEDSPRVVTIYNGVDTSVFDPSIDPLPIRMHLGVAEKRVILYVGRLIPRKGVGYLLKAMQLLNRDADRYALVVCGAGPARSNLEEQASSLGVHKSVKFTGFVSDEELPLYYAAADYCTVPSTSEPFGLVLLEAMSMKKPIVATNVGGIPEVAKDGENAILIPPRDPKAICSAIRMLESDEDLVRRLGLNGRRVVEQRFTWPQIARETNSLYLAVMR